MLAKTPVLMAILLAGCGIQPGAKEHPPQPPVPSRPARAHYIQEGRFSYNPPHGWVSQTQAGDQYPVFVRPPLGGSRTHIMTFRDVIRISHPTYAKAAKRDILRENPHCQLVLEDQMKTDDGKTIYRIRTVNPKSSPKLTQTVYLIGEGRYMFSLLCTTPTQTADENLPLFDQAAKSFRIH